MNGSRFFFSLPKQVLSSNFRKTTSYYNPLKYHTIYGNILSAINRESSCSTHINNFPATDSSENSILHSATSFVRGSSPFVYVKWKDLGRGNAAEDANEYPAVWLRDNCQCPKCYNKHANARLLLMKDLDVDIKPKQVSVEENQVCIDWSDNHTSHYDSSWLRARSFKEHQFKQRNSMANGPKKELWGSEHQADIRYHNFENIVDDEKALLSWITDLSIFGFSIVHNVPANIDGLPQLIQKVGFEKRTHYGTYFSVKSRTDEAHISNLAYTAAELGLHLDLPYYDFVPGVQFLHCIEQYQLEGADNEFSDGFMIEKIMRENFSDEWKVLTELGVPFLDDGTETLDGSGEFNKVKIVPTFALDKQGNVQRVNYNNQVRDQYPVTSLDETHKLYKALKCFNDIAYDKKVMIKHKLRPGECVVFDNHRVLHGRVGYTMDPKGGNRFYNGCYVDWDEILSIYNLLCLRMGLRTKFT